MRSNLLATLLIAALAGTAFAQQAGVHRGLLVGGSNLSRGVSWLLQLDPSNKPTYIQTGGSGLPVAGNFYGLTMDAGNAEIVMGGITMVPIGIGLLNYDPVAKAVVKTIHFGFPSPLAITNYNNLTVNSNGNPVTVDHQTSPQALAEYDQFAKGWVRYNLPTTTVKMAGLAGCEWDEFGGGYLHGAVGTPPTLYRTSPDGKATTLVAQAASGGAGYGGTLLDNGDWISAASTAQGYYVVTGGKWTFVSTPGIVPFDVTHEKYAAPGRGIWISNRQSTVGSAHYIDTTTNTVTTAYVGTSATWPNNSGEITPLYDRDLSTARAGKGTWTLPVNPGNGTYAGMPFLVAASFLPPVRPGGIGLPDGREIYLGLDGLTVMSVNGPVPPFLTGNLGTLDARGRAAAKIDFTSLGTAANGLVLHFCGAVLDAKAPSGLAWVFDPHAFVIDVLP